VSAVLARRIVMAGGVWATGIAGSLAVLSAIEAGGVRGWPAGLIGFAMGHVVWTAAKRVWRWSEVEP
jgi:hypothetical protein